MYYSNNFGCLIVLVIFILIFSFATRLIFTTPLGLVLAIYLIYRWYVGNKKVSVKSNDQPTEEFSSNNNHEEFFDEDEEVIDVDYEDIDD